MKVVGVGPDAVFYRCLAPKWSFVPLSGAGAATGGGRFNRPGIEALYLSRDPVTALAEYQQESSLPPPATLAAFIVTLGRVVDLSSGHDPQWPAPWAEWNCPWKQIARIDRKIPPSWGLADLVIGGGYAGLLFPSTRHSGGTNLVVYPHNLTSSDHMDVHDPDRGLPVGQSSWR